MDKSERESIINETMERILLRIPEIVGNLLTNHAAKVRANVDFYSKHPEFSAHKDVVAAVVESLDDSTEGIDFKKLLEKAVPEIKRKISQVKDLDMKQVKKPNLDFNQGEL